MPAKTKHPTFRKSAAPLPLSVFDFTQQQEEETHPFLALKSGDVAKLLGVTQVTLLNWERAGKLPKTPRTGGGWRVYAWEDFAAILRGTISTGYAGTMHKRGNKHRPKSSV